VATFLTYLLGLLVVGGVLFLLASFAFGRGEELAPMPPDGTPVELPDGRFGSEAVRALRLSVVLRGYRMDEVDWVLDVLANQLDARDQEIARLRLAAGEPAVDSVGEAAEPPAAEAAETAEPPAVQPFEPLGLSAEPVEPARIGEAAAADGRDGAEPPDRAGSPLLAEPPDARSAAEHDGAPARRGFADSPMDRAVRAARAGAPGSAQSPVAQSPVAQSPAAKPAEDGRDG
jgi:DivIVA domain-containing protein